MPAASGQPDATDLRFMRLALEQAERAGAAGEVPVGALVVLEGTVLGAGANRTRRDGLVSAHAEIVALSEAERAFGDFRLEGAVLYVTVEPCLMCLGALLQARIARLVYGAAEPKFGALGGRFDLREHAVVARLDILGGVLQEEAAALLSGFFRELREAK